MNKKTKVINWQFKNDKNNIRKLIIDLMTMLLYFIY